MALRAKRSVIMTSMTALARLTGVMQAEACRRGREEEACFSLCTPQHLQLLHFAAFLVRLAGGEHSKDAGIVGDCGCSCAGDCSGG